MAQVGPYDFSLNIPDPGQAFMQSFDAARQRRDQMAQQQDRQAQLQAYMQRMRTDRSPQMMAEFALAFPEMAQAVTKAYEPLDAQVRQARFSQKAQVYKALERGDVEGARQTAEGLLAAARNTPGQEQLAKEIEYGLGQLDSNPDALKIGLAADMAFSDQKAYETLFGGNEGTSFQKDLAAAGIDPASPEGIAKARQYAELKTDPIVQMPTPSGGQFIGKQSTYYQMFGGGAPPPTVKALPRVGEVRNGFMFNGGDPGDKSNWIKAKPMQETKSPDLNSAGIPAKLTRKQYDAVVQVKGKAETDAWMLRNNIQIAG
jgi:hypothetical protein